MNCNAVREVFDAYMDGMLTPEQMEQIDRHLVECPACAACFQEFSAMLDILKDLDEEELPDGFSDRLHNRLMEEAATAATPSRSNIHKWYKWGAGIAAVFVLLLSIKLLGESGIGQDGAETPEFGIRLAENYENGDAAGALDINGSDAQTRQSAEEFSITDINQEPPADVKDGNVGYITTDEVVLYIQDICIVPDRLYMMALENNLSVDKKLEDGIVIIIDISDQRRILFQELSKLGRVKETGTKVNEDKVFIRLVMDDDGIEQK